MRLDPAGPDRGQCPFNAKRPSLAPETVIFLALTAVASACLATRFDGVREALGRGDYVSAHAQLRAIESANGTLDPREELELRDSLCLAGFMIGRPAVPLAEQRTTCAAAAELAASQSGPLLARIDETIVRTSSEAVANAVRRSDIAGAERAVLAYLAMPGTNRELAAGWARQIWKLVDARNAALEGVSRRRARTATATLEREYRKVASLGAAQFQTWIREAVPEANRLSAAEDRVSIWIAQSSLSAAMRHLDRFARVNDALAARCRCVARTDVGVIDTGLPAFLVRFDVEARRSEILLLPQARATSARSVEDSRAR